jgi:hypothetical protein
VGLAVRTQPHPGLGREIRHAPQVSLESIEIDDERGSIDLVKGHPDNSRRCNGHARLLTQGFFHSWHTDVQNKKGRRSGPSLQ